MNTENYNVYDGVEVALSAVLKPIRNNGYGNIQDWPDDEELASPDELERAYYQELWGPVLQISKPKSVSNNSVWECHTDIDFNAFASVDFERLMPKFDKVKYKADKLKEQLKDLAIMISIVNKRIKDSAKYKVLKLARVGIVDVDDIRNWDMWQLAKLYLRALKLRKQITGLQEASICRKEQQFQKWLDSLG